MREDPTLLLKRYEREVRSKSPLARRCVRAPLGAQLVAPHASHLWKFSGCCHICTGTGPTPATSAPTLGSLPQLRRDWAHPFHICTGTGLAPFSIFGSFRGRRPQVRELKQELAMHDSLANRSRVSYEPFQEEQRCALHVA